MEESLYFSLLRISVAQMLKASGFDKCKPLVLNTVTDLYIRHLELILNSAKKFAIARSNCTNEILAQDLLQAFMDVQFLKPLSFESCLDPRDSSTAPTAEYNTKSVESFKRWLQYSDSYRTSKKLSEVPISMIHNLIDKRKVDTSSETDQERKKRRLRERQEYYNQLKQGDENFQRDMGRLVDDFEEDEITSDDKLSWLTYMAEKDLKLGHNFKFVNTTIQDSLIPLQKNKKFHPPSKNGEDSYRSFQNHLRNSNKYDHVVIQIQELADADGSEKTPIVLPSSQLKNALPYNVKYPDSLMNDDLELYVNYAQTHPEEIEKIVNKKRVAKGGDDILLEAITSGSILDVPSLSTVGESLVDTSENNNENDELSNNDEKQTDGVETNKLPLSQEDASTAYETNNTQDQEMVDANGDTDQVQKDPEVNDQVENAGEDVSVDGKEEDSREEVEDIEKNAEPEKELDGDGKENND